MPYIAAITQRDKLFEGRPTRAQRHFDGPLHSVNSISITYSDRRAAIVVLAICEVDRRHRYPVVRNRKIEFDAECSPGASITDVRFLDRGIRIEHGLTTEFVDARVEVATDIGQDGTFQILVFQIYGAPGVAYSLVGQVLAQGVGVVETRGFK